MKNSLVKSIGIGLLLASGCSNEPSSLFPVAQYPEMQEVAQHMTNQSFAGHSIGTLEGRITSIRRDSIIANPKFGFFNGPINHNFSYVLLKGQDQKEHVLIYPYSSLVSEGNVVVRYFALEDGYISERDFIRNFVNDRVAFVGGQTKKYKAVSQGSLVAEGIIVGNGILYSSKR